MERLSGLEQGCITETSMDLSSEMTRVRGACLTFYIRAIKRCHGPNESIVSVINILDESVLVTSGQVISCIRFKRVWSASFVC